MTRIRIDCPSEFPFRTTLSIRITDLNYGGHVGNDTLLSFIHEARVRFLAVLGIKELPEGGPGLIMADAGIEFRSELFYGDEVEAWVAAAEIGRASFNLYYRFEKKQGKESIVVAMAKTGMVCFDYGMKKVILLPEEWIRALSAG